MEDRCFTEVDLGYMLEHAAGIESAAIEGRWVVFCKHRWRSWEVVVEPEFERQLIVGVTAYPVDEEE